MSLDVYLKVGEETIYEDNVTHNLVDMAEEAGLYEVIWNPLANGYSTARDLVPVLQAGYKELTNNREKYEQFNPPNGWGNYDTLVSFVREYIAACKQNPKAKVGVSA